MSRNRRGRPLVGLLTKTTLFYLVFTSTAFLGSTLFLLRRTDRFIFWEFEHRFGFMEHRLRWDLESGRRPQPFRPRFGDLVPLDGPPASFAPAYSDTLVESPEQGVPSVHRRKTGVIQADGRWYRFTLIAPAQDFYRLREGVFDILIPAWIFLAVAVTAFGFVLSGVLFRPFNRILERMRTYRVGGGDPGPGVDTNTAEFRRMQELFGEMIRRIEEDYRRLKEYTENMAHELQTPLAIVRAKAETLMADDAVMRRHGRDVAAVYDEANHLSRLGQTLNLLTKIENGEFTAAETVDTAPLILRHVEAVRESAALKSIQIETALDPEHRWVIDPHLFEIVLKNMLRNAIRYGTSDGPVRVGTTGGGLSVSNAGAPLAVPPEALFERFSGTAGRATGSLGLGLSIVKKICELNGLAVDYAYDAGRHTFSIRPNRGPAGPPAPGPAALRTERRHT